MYIPILDSRFTTLMYIFVFSDRSSGTMLMFIFVFSDRSWSFCAPVLGLPAAGLPGADGVSPGRSARGPQQDQKETIHPHQRLRWPA